MQGNDGQGIAGGFSVFGEKRDCTIGGIRPCAIIPERKYFAKNREIEQKNKGLFKRHPV